MPSLFLVLTAALGVCLGAFPPDLLLHGVNIHFRSPQDGEMAQIAESYNVVRMDFTWDSIETTKGVYDFSAYDTLVESLNKYNVRGYFILDYGNPLYNNGNAPSTPESVQAFVNFVEASLLHFYGNGIIWEMWNEPNLSYAWKPQPNPTDYATLANAVGNMIRNDSTAPYYNEIYIGPATSGIDTSFLENIFKLGVLNYFDAVSVHPYRNGGPETVVNDYQTLRNLINQYNRNTSNYIPIISGEWGWSTCTNPNDQQQSQVCIGGAAPGNNTMIDQANFLVRQYFVNNVEKIPISIFYDWKNDGNDTTQGEDNFGTVNYQYKNQTMPYVPKLSYLAANTFYNFVGNQDYTLNDFEQLTSKCTSTSDDCEDDWTWAVHFGGTNMAVWYAVQGDMNVINQPYSVDITVVLPFDADGCFTVYDMFGNKMNQMCSSQDGSSISVQNVTQSVTYLLNFNVN